MLQTDNTGPSGALTPLARHTCSGHGVCFYLTPEFLILQLHTHLLPVMREGHGGLLIAKASTIAALDHYAHERGTDLELALNEGRLLVFDAEYCLAHFMVDGMPDQGLFRTFVGTQLRILDHRQPHLHVYNEMVGALCERSQFVAALRVEELWNAFTFEYRYDLLCGYSMELFRTAEHARELEAIRQAHTYCTRR